MESPAGLGGWRPGCLKTGGKGSSLCSLFTGGLGKSPPLSLVSEIPLLVISKNMVQSNRMLTKG